MQATTVRSFRRDGGDWVVPTPSTSAMRAAVFLADGSLVRLNPGKAAHSA